MNRKASDSRTPPHPGPLPEGEGKTRWLTYTALVIALALVIARASMLETLREPFEVTSGSAAAPRGAGAASGVVLDLIGFIPALLVLARSLMDRKFPVRRSIVEILMIGLGAWIALSVTWSSDKYAAAIKAFHWMSGLAMLWAMSQLVGDWLRLRLVAGVCFGLLLVFIAHGLEYRFVEVPDLQKNWLENREKILQARGWEPDSFMAIQFGKKVMGGEMIGFSASPNTFATMIVLTLVISVGVLLQRISDRDEIGWPAVIAIAIPGALLIIYFTHSKAAYLTPIVGAMLTIVIYRFRVLFAARRRLVFGAVIGLFLLGTIALVGHGIAHGSLPEDSLNFRWRYWVGAFRVFIQHPLIGVGFDNFGSHYLAARLPAASEEIRDPHNFIVHFFVELGIVGGVVAIAWMTRLWWEMTAAPVIDAPARSQKQSRNFAMKLAVAIAGIGILINVIASVDFSQMPVYYALELLKRALWLGLLIVGLLVVALRSAKQPELDDRPAPWLMIAMTIALGMFLLHNLIDVSLFESSAMLMFMTIAGAVLGMRGQDDRAISAKTSGIVLGIGAVGWLAALIIFVGPVIGAENAGAEAADLVRQNRLPAAAERYRRAFELAPVSNSDFAVSRARTLIYAGAPPEEIRSALDRATSCDPMAIVPLRMRAQFEAALPSGDFQAFNGSFERLLALNPNDVQARLDYATRLADRWNRPTEAVKQFGEALRYNDLLTPDEPKRLSAVQLSLIDERVRKLDQKP